jgi:hypothetical protein
MDFSKKRKEEEEGDEVEKVWQKKKIIIDLNWIAQPYI